LPVVVPDYTLNDKFIWLIATISCTVLATYRSPYDSSVLQILCGPDSDSDDPKCHIYQDGQIIWTALDRFIPHRVGGPSIISVNGDKYWYVNGKLHRIDGPAVICKNHGKYAYESYYYKGECILKKMFYSPEFQCKIIMES
jgi:hypothetical protein